jgi:hypothetical protein
MRGEPKISIICDKCGESEEFELTALARSAYDLRDLERQLKRAGWVVCGDLDICPECVAKEEDDRDG